MTAPLASSRYPGAKYRHDFVVDDIEIVVTSDPSDPRWDYSRPEVRLHLSSEDTHYEDDDYQDAKVDFRSREELVELIEALKLACNETFDLHLAQESDGAVQLRLGVIAEMDAQRERELARHREAVTLLRDRLNAGFARLKVVEEAADRLYQATQHATHTTSDESVRTGLVNEVAHYDYVRRDLGSFSFADPLEELP